MSRTEHCFGCKEAFVLEDNHELAYRDSGLCPKCFGKAMESMNTLVELLEVNKAILENIKLVNVSLLKLINALALKSLTEV